LFGHANDRSSHSLSDSRCNRLAGSLQRLNDLTGR
jgi:hypothetical protein